MGRLWSCLCGLSGSTDDVAQPQLQPHVQKLELQQRVEVPKPQQRVELPKPQGVELPKPQQQVEVPKPQGVELPKPQQRVEVPKPQQRVEVPDYYYNIVIVGIEEYDTGYVSNWASKFSGLNYTFDGRRNRLVINHYTESIKDSHSACQREWKKQITQTTGGVVFIYSVHSRRTFELLEELSTTTPEICKMRPGLLLGCRKKYPAPWQCIRAEEGAKLAETLGVTFGEIVMNNDLEEKFVGLVKELRGQKVQPVPNRREQNRAEAHAEVGVPV